MKQTRVWQHAVGRILSFLALLTWFAQAPVASAANEDAFDELQVGTHVYRKVTVTTKSKDYIFILHAEGMTNVKVTDLAPEVRTRLGYVEPEKPKAPTNSAPAWAKQTLAKLDMPQVKEMKQQVIQTWNSERVEKLREWSKSLKPSVIFGALAGVFLLYLFSCYCCSLICRKAGHPGGVLVWLPLLQWLPLFRAAGMSGWWFLALFVPVLNILGLIIWCFKIASARGKSVLVGILLLLPPINVIAFLYLAFSGGGEKKERMRNVQMMALETV